MMTAEQRSIIWSPAPRGRAEPTPTATGAVRAAEVLAQILAPFSVGRTARRTRWPASPFALTTAAAGASRGHVESPLANSQDATVRCRDDRGAPFFFFIGAGWPAPS